MGEVWGLIDDRTGHTGQVLGVIGKLGLPYQIKRLEFNRIGRHAPPGLLGASLLGVDRKRSARLAAPWPSLVIASGRRTVPVLRAIKKQSPQTVVVYLMWPGNAHGLDLIVAPEHDNPPDSANVVRTLAPLHAVTRSALDTARSAWLKQFAELPRPWVTLCLGGPTKHGTFTTQDWGALLATAERIAGDGSLLITSSRRTPYDALALAETQLTRPYFLHRWAVDKDNPYFGMLGAADSVIVTGDSLSMCAEACITGKPVYIFAPQNVIPAKHTRLHAALYERGMAQPLEQFGSDAHWLPAAGLDEAAMVAEQIRTRFPHAVAG